MSKYDPMPIDNSVNWGTWLRGAIGDIDLRVGLRIPQGDKLITVASSSESTVVKNECDYVCDGTADEVQINAAIADCGSDTIGYGSNGGTVLLIGRRFNIAAAIGVRTQVHLMGSYGSMGTWIYGVSSFVPGATGGLIQLYSSSTQYATVSDLAINGQGFSACGVYVGVAAAQEWDSFIRLRDLYIVSSGQHGVRWDNISGGRCRGNMAERIRVLNAGQNGFYINCPDSFYSMLDTGSSGSHGFYLPHSNGNFVLCKSWYSDGAGFYLTGGRDNHFASCEAQDNLNHGWHIAAQRNSFGACIADSNGYNGVASTGQPKNLGSGFFVSGNGNNIQGTASDKNEGGREVRQQYPLQTSGAVVLMANIVSSSNVNTGAAVANGYTSASGSSIINVLDY